MIKKIIMMMIAAMAMVCAQAAMTYTETVDGIEWIYTVTDGKASVDGGSSYPTAIPKTTSGAITIPSMLGGFPVASIGNNAFFQCDKLTSVTISDSVTSIGWAAFEDCSGLTSVTIPDSVTSIGSSAFSGCSGLTSVTIPDSVTSIEDFAFYGCSGLTSVTIPDSVTSIGYSAFYGCSSLTSVTMPDSVTSIGYYAFYGCSSLTSVTMGNGVTSIEDFAFYGCSSLTSVTIPDSVTSIGSSAFEDCSGLLSITVEEGNPTYKSVNGLLLTNDGKTLVLGVNGAVTIPDSVTRIGSSAFSGCSGLTSVTIPDSVTSIGSYAFYGCSSLTSVTMGNGVTSIGYSAFEDCSSLTSVTMGNGVTSIEDEAFCGCSSLTSVTMGNGVTSIGYSAFEDCSSLTSVTMGNGVTSIEDYAFKGCSSLTSVTIPDSVTSIGSYAFEDCSGLLSITVEEGNSTYKSVNGLLLTNDGKTLVQGVNGAVTIPDSVTSIGYSAFEGCSSLTSVTIPDSVTSIGYYAFEGCSSLTNIVFKGNAPSVEYYAFSQIGADCIARVPRNATGFDVDSNGKWQGMTVVYYDLPEESVDDDVSGGGGDDGEIGDADGAGGTNRVVRADGPSALQAAIEAANEGDVILVGPGTYSPIRTNGKKITIKSTDGAAKTIIDGGSTNRCATLADDTMGDWWLGDDSEQEQCVPLEPYNTILIGFTLCNGKSSWKGRVEYYEDGSQANVFFPRVVDGGGVFGGNIVNCVISNNVSELVFEKGSIFYEEDEESGEMVEEITEEDYEESQGGGVSCAKLYNCLVTRNRSTGSGSGIDRCYAYNCTIVANVSATHEDEDLNDVFDVENSEIHNTIMSVTPYWDGGYAMDVGDVRAEGCAIVSETGGALPCNYFDECWDGDGNIYSYDFIVGDMKFVNPSIGDYRLQQGSAAIDAGNESYVQPLNSQYGDLDQNKRIKDIVDIGAYEYGASPLVVPVYEMSFASGGATEGSAPEVISFKADEEVELPGCGSLSWLKHTFIGWSDGISTYDSGAIYTGESNVVMTAQWVRNELSEPVIFAPETFEADSCDVTITCDSGATIHYTLDGADPTAESSVYTEPIVITGTTEIKAIAIRDNYFDSTIASFTVTRGVWTFGEYLNWSGQEFTTSGDVEWIREKGVSDDGYALKSGKILRNQKSCLTTTVQGAGTISFMLKVSSEADEETNEPYDGFVLAVDGVDVTELIGGEIDWRRVSFKIVGDGLHNIEWRYEKDKSVDVGEDCAWIDEIVWTPEDPIPDLGDLATASEVAAALEGSADVKLSANIHTVAEYAAYRTWALKLGGVTPREVKDSPNAWLSYALDTEALIVTAPEEGDVVIDTFESAATDGAFEFTVKIDGIEVGDGALEANIRKVFDIEGAEKLDMGDERWDMSNVEVNAAASVNGNVKFTVTPKMEGGEKPNSFFFRVKMK